MALNSILRRSASTVAPLAARLLGGQRTFNHHAGGALFTAANHIISNNSFLVPSVTRFSYSASPPSSDESFLRVIQSDIKSFEAGEEVHKFKSYFGGPKSDGSNENLQKADFRKISPMIYNSSTYRNVYSSGSTRRWRGLSKTRKRASLMTHYFEVNYKTLKAVMFYGPSIESSPVRALLHKNVSL